MLRPELKQFGDLLPADFERHPVWIGCHGEDADEPWYDETDEETFRPWTGALPAAPSAGTLLVRATFELRDGSRYLGFVTPTFVAGDLGAQHPHMFIDDRRFWFWGGMFGIPPAKRRDFYAAIGKSAEAVFPVRFGADPGLATGATSGEAGGFYRRSHQTIEIER